MRVITESRSSVYNCLIVPQGFVLWAACAIQGAHSCDSCGRECAAACGTRHFRTCCFNYLRKRSANGPSLVDALNYNEPVARARQGEDWWKRGGGVAVYRGFLNADDAPQESDFDVELLKGNNENLGILGGRGATAGQGMRLVSDS